VVARDRVGGIAPIAILTGFSLSGLSAIYRAQDFISYAERIERATESEFPLFVVERRGWYAARLREMALDPEALRNVRALNALRFLDLGTRTHRRQG
jgi:hypothetical protein